MSIWPVLLLSMLALAASMRADDVVWSIGTYNDSPLEFAATPTTTRPFVAGRGDASREWPRSLQAGETAQIAFVLPELKGAYALQVDVLLSKPRTPVLKIDLNGHLAKFYLHPKLIYSPGEMSYSFVPRQSAASVVVDLPATFLREGQNLLQLGCTTDPETARDRTLAGLSFDSVSMRQRARADTLSARPQLEFEPTIFYQGTASGGLSETVNVFVRSGAPAAVGHIDLELRGKHYAADLKPSLEWGDQRVSFDVAAWQGATTAKVRLPGADSPTSVQLTPARKWTLFTVPHTHLDVGFTDFQGKVAETQARVIGQAMELVRHNPTFCFSMDGSWNLEQFLATRSPANVQELIRLMRAEKISVPAQYANLLTGYASLETLYRSLYYSKHIATQYRLPFLYANITDVPTYSGAYPSVLAASGIKYFVAAANNDRAPLFAAERWNERSPFYWVGPDGGRVLVWYSRHYQQMENLFGLPPSAEAAGESLPVFLQAFTRSDYPFDAVLLYGAQVENTDLYPQIATFAGEWNRRYAYPKIQYSTFPQFFRYLETHGQGKPPQYAGDGSGYWEDGVASDARNAAIDRRNQSRVLNSEVISTLSHTLEPDVSAPAGGLEQIWRDILLFAEHTWYSYNAVSQPGHEETRRQAAVKDGHAEHAALAIDDLIDRSLSQLADRIHIPARTLVVVNPLSWNRRALIDVDVPAGQQLFAAATNEPVPALTTFQANGYQHLKAYLANLPALGYRCYRLGPASGEQQIALPNSTTTLENRFYRVELDPGSGSLRHIFDKELNRELADSASSYQFGQYLYVSGGDGNTRMIHPFTALPAASLEIHPASGGSVQEVVRSPWGQTARMQTAAYNTPHIETTVTLPNDDKEIVLSYRLIKTATTSKEAVYFAFPAKMQAPQFAYGLQQGWADPARTVLRGGSLEWFSLHGWTAAHDDTATLGVAPLDTPLVSLGDINRGRWPREFRPASASLFAYVMNNYWHTNYGASQGGEFQFRFAVTSRASFHPAELARWSMTHLRPVEINQVVSQDKPGNPERPLPPEGKQFLDATSPYVALVTWKLAENGNGTIARLLNLDGQPQPVQLHFPDLQLRSAARCSGVEDDVEPLPIRDGAVRLTLRPYESATVRLVF